MKLSRSTTGMALAAWLSAAVVPWLALDLAGGGDRPARQALSPFGWDRLIIVHVLATLPLCALAAAAIQRRFRWTGSRRTVGWSGIGVALAGATVAFGQSVGPQLDLGDVGLIGRLLTRVVWCAALVLPWCLAAVASSGEAATREPTHDGNALRKTALHFALAILVAVALPAAYADHLVVRQTAAAAEKLRRQRVTEVIPTLTALREVGSEKPIGGLRPAACLHQSKAVINELEARVSRPLASPFDSTAVDPVAICERAAMLAALDRGAEGAEMIASLAQSDPRASLLLGAIRQQQKDWPVSTAAYRHALELFALTIANDSIVAAGRVRAYDGIAFNAREMRQYQEAEAAYLEGMHAVPAAHAHFHFQLGTHYQLGGRPLKAAEHLRTAAELDPANYATASTEGLSKLHLNTPGCLIRPGWTSPVPPLSR